MYRLLRSITLRQLATEQAPVALTALGCAEVFYKFHSFTLECLAFLCTWWVLDFVVDSAKQRWLQVRLTSR
jgi:hypothetical protein